MNIVILFFCIAGFAVLFCIWHEVKSREQEEREADEARQAAKIPVKVETFRDRLPPHMLTYYDKAPDRKRGSSDSWSRHQSNYTAPVVSSYADSGSSSSGGGCDAGSVSCDGGGGGGGE